MFPITSGHHEGQTFIQWSGNFSSDADAGTLIFLHVNDVLKRSHIGRRSWLIYGTGVIEDAKFKRREALADLAKLVKK